ncbi:MAG: AAA family ATPase, partial [Nocardioides sp.]|uniref:AAA family ATPase n=1 Tax=Nocardioides sp. TaxID=35761 RepID=UPI003EFE1E86
MRIHRVSMAGFGPFRGEVLLDVDAFAPHGLFLINGPTGSGKSTLLDAIVFALYGSAPRYSTHAGAQVRSQFCTPDEPTWVELEFTADETTYRVRRSPEYLRPRARGEGTTPERATAELSRWDGTRWVGLESQLRTVGQRLFEILPLTAEQFLQVVLLAQGQFEQFLVASSADRQPLLRTLFDSERFADYDHAFQQRAAALRAGVERAEETASAALATLCAHAEVEPPEEPDEQWLDTVLRAQADAVATSEALRAEAQQEATGARSLL